MDVYHSNNGNNLVVAAKMFLSNTRGQTFTHSNEQDRIYECLLDRSDMLNIMKKMRLARFEYELGIRSLVQVV